jgi:hypothetical protein
MQYFLTSAPIVVSNVSGEVDFAAVLFVWDEGGMAAAHRIAAGGSTKSKGANAEREYARRELRRMPDFLMLLFTALVSLQTVNPGPCLLENSRKQYTGFTIYCCTDFHAFDTDLRLLDSLCRG